MNELAKEQELLPSKGTATSSRVWFKRLGILGFTFFLVKGLVWLAVLLGVGQFF